MGCLQPAVGQQTGKWFRDRKPGQADGLNNRGEAVLNPGAIAEQIFEIELSEYKGMVCFTPFAPGGGEETFHMEITQNENLLASIPGYVP